MTGYRGWKKGWYLNKNGYYCFYVQKVLILDLKTEMKRDSRFIKFTGFGILTIACILFLLIPVVPWLGFSAGKIAGISAGLLIAGEVLFYLSLFILGRSYYDKLRSRLKSWIKRTRGTKTSAASEEM
jgi:hypothetical protein